MTAGGLPQFGAQRPPIDPQWLARSILSQARFRMHLAAPARKTWWDAVTAWLADRWKQLIDAFAAHVHVGAKTSVAAGDVVLALAACVVLIVTVRLLSGAVRDANHNVRVPRENLPPRTAEALYAQSVRCAELGEYAAAIALLFRAGLGALDVRGIVHDEPSRTVNECRMQVRAHAPRAAAPFEALAWVFTAVVYADARVTAGQWDAAHRAYAQLARAADDAA